jgi:hypothetical protein
MERSRVERGGINLITAIREHLKGHTQPLDELAIEMLARGVSVRDIEDACAGAGGRNNAAVS